MPDCHRCGASVEVVETKTGEKITLDTYESVAGPGRWTVSVEGVATELDRFSDLAGQTEHKLTCSSGADPGSRVDMP